MHCACPTMSHTCRSTLLIARMYTHYTRCTYYTTLHCFIMLLLCITHSLVCTCRHCMLLLTLVFLPWFLHVFSCVLVHASACVPYLHSEPQWCRFVALVSHLISSFLFLEALRFTPTCSVPTTHSGLQMCLRVCRRLALACCRYISHGCTHTLSGAFALRHTVLCTIIWAWQPYVPVCTAHSSSRRVLCCIPTRFVCVFAVPVVLACTCCTLPPCLQLAHVFARWGVSVSEHVLIVLSQHHHIGKRWPRDMSCLLQCACTFFTYQWTHVLRLDHVVLYTTLAC